MYRCAVIGACETLYTNPVLLTVLPTPGIPVLQLNAGGDSLVAVGSADSYLWTLDGTELSETGPTLALSASGSYTVQAFLGSCGGPVSQPFVWTGLANTVLPQGRLQLWPNPGSQELQVRLPVAQPFEQNVALINASGVTVFRGKVGQNAQMLTVLPGVLPAGLYTLVISSEQGVMRGIWMVQ